MVPVGPARARGRRAEGDRALVRGVADGSGGGRAGRCRGRPRCPAARGRPAEDERAPGDHLPGARAGLRLRGRDRRRAVGARRDALGLDLGGRGYPRVGGRRGAPGDPSVLVAAEAGLVRAVGAPRGGGLRVAAVRVRRCGTGRCGVLVEEVRAGLLHEGRGRVGWSRERAAAGGRRPAGARYPGGTVPVPDVSRDGRVRVVPLAGPVVAGCRGWGAHVRRPVSARGWDGGLHIYQTDASPTASPALPAPFRATPCTLFTRSEPSAGDSEGRGAGRCGAGRCGTGGPVRAGAVRGVRKSPQKKFPQIRVMVAALSPLHSYEPTHGPAHGPRTGSVDERRTTCSTPWWSASWNSD